MQIVNPMYSVRKSALSRTYLYRLALFNFDQDQLKHYAECLKKKTSKTDVKLLDMKSESEYVNLFQMIDCITPIK